MRFPWHRLRAFPLLGWQHQRFSCLLGPQDHLQQARIGKPLTEIDRKAILDRDYFNMIEAVEFTR